jgi:ribosomal protein S27E
MGKRDGPGKPTGPGEMGSAGMRSGNEVEGHGRQMTVTCYNCGAHQYVGQDSKWFTCWKCGATSSEVMVA